MRLLNPLLHLIPRRIHHLLGLLDGARWRRDAELTPQHVCTRGDRRWWRRGRPDQRGEVWLALP